MPTLNLKPTHKIVLNYYRTLQKTMVQTDDLTPAFANLLHYCARKVGLRLAEQECLHHNQEGPRVEGVLLNNLQLRHGIWKVKDSQEDFNLEIQQKFQAGYPNDNILFQSPDRLVLYQGHLVPVFDQPIGDSPTNLISGLKLFFEYQKPTVKDPQTALVEFQGQIADLGQRLVNLLRSEYQTNKPFRKALNRLTKLYQETINPNFTHVATQELLAQHLLAERLFGKVFDTYGLVQKAKEIEAVLDTFTTPSIDPTDSPQLEKFHALLEQTIAIIELYQDKQPFLKALYERFFQNFTVNVADTHGIVQTPQAVIDFMVKSVKVLLQREFGRTFADAGVTIIDPFAGTGNFITAILEDIHATHPARLTDKYLHELYCNEFMLLPYYIACLNIEQTFFQKTGEYQKFENGCLVDTFDLVDGKPTDLLVPGNLQRVLRQQDTPFFIILGNPPYNAWQQNENDNNKNRKYPKLDELIANSYVKDSTATLKNSLYDPYVRAFRWATWRLRDQPEGIVALVTNNGFLDNLAFDGMRKHLAKDFDLIYCFDLGGNTRKTSGVQNVFDVRVGLAITVLIKNHGRAKGIFYAHIGDHLKKSEKLAYLANHSLANVAWLRLTPDQKHTWLTMGLQPEFDQFIPLGTKAAKAIKNEVTEGVIFKLYSRGVMTCRDTWVYNFNRAAVTNQIQRMIGNYNEQVAKWKRHAYKRTRVDSFVTYDDSRLSWDGHLKQSLASKRLATFDETKVRRAQYRPFAKQYLYFDRMLNNRVYLFPSLFPTPESESQNQAICVCAAGNTKAFHCLMVNVIPDLHLTGDSQCFPFYVYNEAGNQRQENITDWALSHFRRSYQDSSISKWDIFYYIYGLLHHPTYREKYATNLRRELPRVPLVSFGTPKEGFWALSRAGRQLGQLHLHYERQPQYPLPVLLASGKTFSYRVDKMRLTNNKESLVYNDTLTLTGIPAEVFEYRLGNRSALEWVIDQYQVTIDGHRGRRDQLERLNEFQVRSFRNREIVNDPHSAGEEGYVLRLIGQVVWISVETVKIVKRLPEQLFQESKA